MLNLHATFEDTVMKKEQSKFYVNKIKSLTLGTVNLKEAILILSYMIAVIEKPWRQLAKTVG